MKEKPDIRFGLAKILYHKYSIYLKLLAKSVLFFPVEELEKLDKQGWAILEFAERNSIKIKIHVDKTFLFNLRELQMKV